MSEVIGNRSDAIPGIYKCVECGQQIGTLQESWRRPVDPLTGGSLSTLFCFECAQHAREIGLDVAPIQLSRVELLSLGIYQEGI